MNHFLCKNCECIGKKNYSKVMVNKFKCDDSNFGYKKDDIKCDREEYMRDIKRCSVIISVGIGLGRMCYIETDRGFETHMFSFDTGFYERKIVGDIVEEDNELYYGNNEPVQQTILKQSILIQNIVRLLIFLVIFMIIFFLIIFLIIFFLIISFLWKMIYGIFSY